MAAGPLAGVVAGLLVVVVPVARGAVRNVCVLAGSPVTLRCKAALALLSTTALLGAPSSPKLVPILVTFLGW